MTTPHQTKHVEHVARLEVTGVLETNGGATDAGHRTAANVTRYTATLDRPEQWNGCMRPHYGLFGVTSSLAHRESAVFDAVQGLLGILRPEVTDHLVVTLDEFAARRQGYWHGEAICPPIIARWRVEVDMAGRREGRQAILIVRNVEPATD